MKIYRNERYPSLCIKKVRNFERTSVQFKLTHLHLLILDILINQEQN